MFGPENDDSYPAEVRRALAKAKREGLPWAKAKLLCPSPPEEWKAMGRIPLGEESPIQFMWRHMQAAYYNVDPLCYCAIPACTRLTAGPLNPLCVEHAEAVKAA